MLHKLTNKPKNKIKKMIYKKNKKHNMINKLNIQKLKNKSKNLITIQIRKKQKKLI